MPDTDTTDKTEPEQTDIEESEYLLEGVESADERITVRLIFRNAAEIGVSGSRFAFQRHRFTGKIVAWEFVGIDHQLGFDPAELLAWEVVHRERIGREGDGVAADSGA